MEHQPMCGTVAPSQTYIQTVETWSLCVYKFIPVFLKDIFNSRLLWASCINRRRAVRGLCIDFFAVIGCINRSWLTESNYWSRSNVFSICLLMFDQRQEEQLQQVSSFMFYWSHLDMNTVTTPGGQNVTQRAKMLNKWNNLKCHFWLSTCAVKLFID